MLTAAAAFLAIFAASPAVAVASDSAAVAEPPSTAGDAARPGVISGPNATLTDEQMERCVAYRKATIKHLEMEVVRAQENRRAAADRREGDRVKVAAQMEHDTRAALARASNKKPADYWPEVQYAEGLESEMKLAKPSPATPSTSAATPVPDPHAGKVWVKGYTKKNGTKVQGYWRRK
jgi:hypothetical protein